MLRLLEIRPGAVVCDPMCGTGSIPIEVRSCSIPELSRSLFRVQYSGVQVLHSQPSCSYMWTWTSTCERRERSRTRARSSSPATTTRWRRGARCSTRASRAGGSSASPNWPTGPSETIVRLWGSEEAASRARSESACSSSSGYDTAAGGFSKEPPNCSQYILVLVLCICIFIVLKSYSLAKQLRSRNRESFVLCQMKEVAMEVQNKVCEHAN